jgi:hypothetical protein
MHSSFNFGSQLQHCFPSFHNQRCVQYPPNRLFVGSGNFQSQTNRSFASVVGFPSTLIIEREIQPTNHIENHKFIINTRTSPHKTMKMMANKEFHDFKHMPTMITHGHPVMDQSSPDTTQTKSFHKHIESAVGRNGFLNPRNLVSSFLRNYQSSPQLQPQKQINKNNQPSHNRNNHTNRYQNKRNPHFDSNTSHHYQNAVPKNCHKKDRSSLERVIHDDVCDLDSKISENDENLKKNQLNTTQKTANDASPSKNKETDEPPFLIYSLEDFPAIVNATRTKMKGSKKRKSRLVNTSKKCDDKLEDEFVIIASEASASTPPFEPPKLSLCDKLMRSPKKLLTNSRFPLKPILKLSRSRRRSVSECSDDWIQFVPEPNVQHMEVDDEEESDLESDFDEEETSDSDSESDEEDNPESEIDDESVNHVDEHHNNDFSDGEDDETTNIKPFDSGIEDKKVKKNSKFFYRIQSDVFTSMLQVRFNSNPKVHVMRVWDYAYRSYRKGDYWQQFARDNERFKKRIQEQEKILAPILNQKHRERIFEERVLRRE